MSINKNKGETPETTKTVDECLSELSAAVSSKSTVGKKDKKGGKASDAEVSKLTILLENSGKIENDLPRNFDAANVSVKKAELESKQKQIVALDQIRKGLLGQATMLRIELKPRIKEMYEASKKAALSDITLQFIPDAVKVCYEKTPSEAKKKKAKKTTTPPQ